MRHPIPDYLASLITELGAVNPGETAQYIPVLAEADPDRLGIALATPTGRLHSAGDADVESVSYTHLTLPTKRIV